MSPIKLHSCLFATVIVAVVAIVTVARYRLALRWDDLQLDLAPAGLVLDGSSRPP